MFLQIDDYAGVDTGAHTPSIMVPAGDYNLIVHDQGRGASPSAPGIAFVDLTDDLKKGAGVAQHSLAQLVSGLDPWRATDLLHDASAMNLGGAKRLIAITAKTARDSSVKIGNASLDIAVRKRRVVTLSLLYYQYTGDAHADDWQAMGGGLNSGSHSNAAINGINKYFTPQANVFFKLQSVKDWTTENWINSTKHGPDAKIPNVDIAGGKQLAKTLTEKGLLDKSADIGVVVVPMLKEADAINVDKLDGQYGDTIFVPWIFSNIYKFDAKAEYFVPELCHELVHGLGKKEHSSRANVMCNDHTNSTLDKELLIDKVTLDKINAL